MPIRFACSCGKNLTAPDHYAGKRARCTRCGQVVEIPGNTLAADARPEGYWSQSPSLMATAAAAVASQKAALAPPPKTARDYMYLLLLLALVPLVMILFQGTPPTLEQRLDQTLEAHPELLENPAVMRLLSGPCRVRDLLAEFPGHRFTGALLGYDSSTHWVMAVASAALFLLLIVFFFAPGSASSVHVLLVGLFTGTVGMLLLWLVQALAEATRGVVVAGGIITLPFWIFKIIGGSYDAAMDPNTNFFISAFGFTVGVGFLEEVCKALPLLWHYRVSDTLGWRGACLWGLASGVGFGVCEGIFYSRDFYNGIHGPGVYLMRFLSCVALHAVWTGSVGIFVYQQRDQIQRTTLLGWPGTALGVVVASTFLHGLYDTLLKKQHPAIALLIALASFVLLALQIEHMRKREPNRTPRTPMPA